MVQEKKEDLKGLITDEGALFIIAKELGVEVRDDEDSDMMEISDAISINQVTSGMKSVAVVGRIKYINKIRTFTSKKDGSEGQVGSFVIQDATGDIQVVLWNEKVQFMKREEFVINELVQVVNASCKQSDYDQKLEISVGTYGGIQLQPDDVSVGDYPSVCETADGLSTVDQVKQEADKEVVSFKGKIVQVDDLRKVTTRNGEETSLLSFMVGDGTGIIKVAIWGERAEENESVIKQGESLALHDVRTKHDGSDDPFDRGG